MIVGVIAVVIAVAVVDLGFRRSRGAAVGRCQRSLDRVVKLVQQLFPFVGIAECEVCRRVLVVRRRLRGIGVCIGVCIDNGRRLRIASVAGLERRVLARVFPDIEIVGEGRVVVETHCVGRFSPVVVE